MTQMPLPQPHQPWVQPPPPVPVGKPVVPSEYQQMLRNSRRAWWKPVLALVVTVLTYLVISTFLLVAGFVCTTLAGTPGGIDTLSSTSSPAGFLLGNLSLAAFIPSVIVGLLAGHQVRPRVTFSVIGRFRWGWAGRLALALLPLWAAFILAGAALDGFSHGPRPRAWVALLVICLLTTPLQCAGEEYIFRVWFMQSLGSYFPPRWLAFVFPVLLSVPAFALAHGSLDPWVLADIGLFAAAASLVTWRTGGIEAAIVMHTANNVSLMVWGLVAGGFDDMFVSTSTTSNPISVVISAIQLSIAVAVVFLLARFRGPERVGDPEAFRLGR